MKVQIAKTFPLPGGPEAAWALLRDIEAVTACMPGARITEKLDDSRYKGTVQVKLGPASLSFRGEVEVKEVEPATRTLKLAAKGTDSSGSSAATMDLTARIDPGEAGGCQLVGASEVSMSGKVATFGARMMGPVSDQILQQFAANFATRLRDAPAPEAAAAGAAPAESASGPAPQQQPLNGMALAWAMLRDWFRNLFRPKRA